MAEPRRINDAEIDDHTWQRWHFDAKYHAAVYTIGHLLATALPRQFVEITARDEDPTP